MITAEMMSNHWNRSSAADIESVKASYIDLLGLATEEFNLGWVAHHTDAGLTGGVRPAASHPAGVAGRSS